MKSVVFFNNKGGVGKTTFTYHLGFSLERQGKKVLFVDVDPQCNLSAHLCTEDIISLAWGEDGESIYKAVEPIVKGSGVMKTVEPYKIPDRNIWVFIGDLLLSDFESELSSAWTQILAGQERGFRVTSAIYKLITEFGENNDIDYILIDIGPNLGALNRAILLGCDNFLIPMIPDMFSLRGSQNIGRVLASWIKDFQLSKQRMKDMDFRCIYGQPKFSGYILQQFRKYRSRRTRAFEEWASQIPDNIEEYVISPLTAPELSDFSLLLKLDSYQVAEFKNYNSLIPYAQAALKPVFELTSEDGVVGKHKNNVNDCLDEFDRIASYFTSII